MRRIGVGLVGAVAAAILMSACGSDAGEANSDVTLSAAGSSIASTLLVAPGTSEPDIGTDSQSAFCTAVEEYYVHVDAATEYVMTPVGFSSMVPLMVESARKAADTAPSEQVAAMDDTVAALEVLEARVTELDGDVEQLTAADVTAADAAFGLHYLTIESYLRDDCARDIGALTDRAADIAAEVDSASDN
jgi:hypothetical protein